MRSREEYLDIQILKVLKNNETGVRLTHEEILNNLKSDEFTIQQVRLEVYELVNRNLIRKTANDLERKDLQRQYPNVSHKTFVINQKGLDKIHSLELEKRASNNTLVWNILNYITSVFTAIIGICFKPTTGD